MSIRVAAILERKGEDVFTISPASSVGDAAARLTEHNVGALVVSDDGDTVAGIISERDIVRLLSRVGPECLQQSVSEAMSSSVTTCTREANIDELMATMTNSRFRHVPVVEDGRLQGIISIGDVVKSRIVELETRAESLEEYVTGSSY